MDKVELHYLSPNPMTQFQEWLQDAVEKTDLDNPNAMTLATVDALGQPNARVVLLKGISHGCFQFFTNYESQKAQELTKNNKAALAFYWDALQRQVRVQGVVTKLSSEESTAYFHTRPRGSQIGAWTSRQSRAIPSRAALEQKFAEDCARFHDVNPIPRPEYWGGYSLRPTRMEFWIQQESRLHDRFVYTLEDGNWHVARLSP